MFGKKVLSGALWAVGGSITARAVGLLGTLIITRYLTPDVLGEVGVAVIFTLTASQLSDIGFGQYVVCKPNAGNRAVFHVTVLNLGMALLAMLLVLPLASRLAPAFGAPDMFQYVPGMVLATLLNRLATVPESVLLREGQFRTVSIGNAVPEFIYTAVAITLAVSGFGGMAVVIGNIVQASVRLATFVMTSTREHWLTPARLTHAHTREIVSFGGPLAIGSLCSLIATKWDNMMLSSMFGPKVMGAYNLAYNLSSVPADHVGTAVSDVLMPSFARMSREQARLALVRALGTLALVIMPLSIGIAAISETLVSVVFNEEWQGVAPFLLVLSLFMSVTPIGNAMFVYMQARSMTRVVMVLAALGAAVTLSLVYLGGRWGPLGAAVGAGATDVLMTGIALTVIWKLDGVSVLATLAALAGPSLAAAAMFGGIFGLKFLVGNSLPEALSLASQVVFGAVVYVIAALVFSPRASREVLETFKRLLRPGGEV